AIERDVDDAERDGIAPIDLVQDPPQTLRDVDAARADSDQSKVLGAAAALDDLVSDAHERPLDRLPVHDLPRAVLAHGHSRRANPSTRAKKTPPRPSREAGLHAGVCGALIETLPDLAGSS